MSLMLASAIIALCSSCGTVVTTIFDTPGAELPGAGGKESEPATDATSTAPADRSRPEVPVTMLASGSQSSVRIPVATTIEDSVSFRDAWAAVHASSSDPPPVPDIDFTKETVVILGLGERRTGGYDVQISSAYRRNDTIVVVIRTIAPGPDEMVAQVLTSPFLVAAVTTDGRPVVFTGDNVTLGYDPEL